MIITDTHKAIKIITASGLPDAQAEAVVNAINEHGAELVTKDHLDMRLKSELKDLETRLTIRMIVILALFTAVIKWL
ncbi:MAG: DUF1640 domain-containing protein [Gammaproteobacteria bacterium]|nr:DUF1640 domain-containing protein [Gammaproteobacteria bacterium]MDE0284207.1 DUF1640 domain-containing protein [Gammaproteobacteria bacterium]